MNFTTQKYLTSSCVINILRLTVYSGDMTSHTDRCYKLIALSNQTVLFLSLSLSISHFKFNDDVFCFDDCGWPILTSSNVYLGSLCRWSRHLSEIDLEAGRCDGVKNTWVALTVLLPRNVSLIAYLSRWTGISRSLKIDSMTSLHLPYLFGLLGKSNRFGM